MLLISTDATVQIPEAPGPLPVPTAEQTPPSQAGLVATPTLISSPDAVPPPPGPAILTRVASVFTTAGSDIRKAADTAGANLTGIENAAGKGLQAPFKIAALLANPVTLAVIAAVLLVVISMILKSGVLA